MSDRARQQAVNFLMLDLVTGLPAFILLLGLFCWYESKTSDVNKPTDNKLLPLQLTLFKGEGCGLPYQRQGTLLSVQLTNHRACDPQGMWL